MSIKEDAIKVLDDWYTRLEVYQDKLPARGSVGAALHVLNRLRNEYQLDIAAHVADGEAQITGLSAGSVRKILEDFGEKRPLSAVGGRSNRGARGDVARLLERMRPLRLERVSESVRNKTILAMQKHLVAEYVSRFFAVKRVKALYDAHAATWRFVQTILDNARGSGKAGAVAEYMVGAKLALRFPDQSIRNKRFSTSDTQSGFAGDFEIGDTAFHVTVAPMPELFDKCRANLESGLRVWLLVPESHVVGARQNAQLLMPGRIAVEAIECFISTNLDELSQFDGQRLKSGLRRFLEEYNRRVDDVELDKSMLIEIPGNLD